MYGSIMYKLISVRFCVSTALNNMAADDSETGPLLLDEDDARTLQYDSSNFRNVSVLPSERVTAGSIAFHNISYEVVELKKCRKQPPRTILHSVR